MRLKIAILMGSLAIAAAGQSQRKLRTAQDSPGVSGVTPSLGFVVGTDSVELRPVLGLRAFAGIGAPIALANPGTRTILSPDQRYALVQSAEGNWTAVLPDTGTAGARLAAMGEKATAAVISPSGNSAAFYRSDGAQVEVVSGLPERPQLVFSAKLPAGATLVSMAVNDSADAVLAGLDYGETGSLLVLRANDSTTTVMQGGLPSAIAFEKNSGRAVVADRRLNQVLSVVLGKDAHEVQVLAGEELHVLAPSALAIDRESGRVVVLNGGTRNILVLAPGGKRSSVLECPFEPARITALRDTDAFAISSADGRASGLIRMESAEPVISYLPAVE